jgi:receptor protein-tyrosine kinase
MGIVERAASRLGSVRVPEEAAVDAESGGEARPDVLERAASLRNGHAPAATTAPPQAIERGIAAAIDSAAWTGDRSAGLAGAHARRTAPHDSGSAGIGAVDAVTPPPSLVLDQAWLASHNMITSDGARTQVAENFRRIKRHVLANVLKPRSAPVNRLMVTSALPREGKTFCSINLALSMAQELDRDVLLVDADTLRPSVLASLGVEAEGRGLMDLLVDPKLDPVAVIRRTNVERLSILPAGLPNARATELLGSEQMRSLIDRLAGYYDDRVVIFDSPPLLLASEASALATHMSQILMVVAAGDTTVAAIKDALRRLDGCEGPVAMVLNKKEQAGAGYAYYGYGYGYGASHGT